LRYFCSLNLERKGLGSVSCAIALRSSPPSYMSTCNGQRSSQLSCVHYTFHASRIMETATRSKFQPVKVPITCMNRLRASPALDSRELTCIVYTRLNAAVCTYQKVTHRRDKYFWLYHESTVQTGIFWRPILLLERSYTKFFNTVSSLTPCIP
jgi:hypothetical protein